MNIRKWLESGTLEESTLTTQQIQSMANELGIKIDVEALHSEICTGALIGSRVDAYKANVFDTKCNAILNAFQAEFGLDMDF